MAHPWKTCACGNRMASTATTCQKCRRKPEAYICPKCGGPKSFPAKHCLKCREVTHTAIGLPNRGEKRDFSELDPLWVAQFVGWFHGEGCARIHKTSQRTYNSSCVIKLRADDQAVLKDIQAKLGGRFALPGLREGHTQEAIWETTNIYDSMAVMELIRDNTIIPGKKLQDVLICLDFIYWRLAQPHHGADWSYAAELKAKLQASRVFKVLDEG